MNDTTDMSGDMPEDEFDPARILFHGGGLLVVDKPSGVPVEAGTGHDRGVVELVAEWVRMNPGVIDLKAGKSPFPVHHIDLEASGVLLLALRRPMARTVQNAFAAGSIESRWLTFVAGPIPAEGTFRSKVRTRIKSQYQLREGELGYRRICGDDRLSLVEVTPGQSRRHLVRALLAASGRPVAGDARYGKPKPAAQFLERFDVPHLLLHSTELELPPQVLGKARTLVAPLPAAFERVAESKGWTSDPAWMALTE